MFGTDPRALVAGLPRKRYRKYQAYYRYVNGYKPDTGQADVTVEKTGAEIESDAVIIDG